MMFVKYLKLGKILLNSHICNMEVRPIQNNAVDYKIILRQFVNNCWSSNINITKEKLMNQFLKSSSSYPYHSEYQPPLLNSSKYKKSKLHIFKHFKGSTNSVVLLKQASLLIHSSLFRVYSYSSLQFFSNSAHNQTYCKRNFSTKYTNDLHGRISSLKAKKRIHRKKRSINEHSEENAEGFPISSNHTFQTFDPEFSMPDFLFHKPSPREFQIVAYATAEEYDLGKISDGFSQQGLYCLTPVSQHCNKEAISLVENSNKPLKMSEPEDVLHFSATYHVTPETREMYVFRDGVIVFWNIPMLERKSILKFIQQYEDGPYNENVIQDEAETLIYAYSDSNTRLKPSQDLILLNEHGPLNLEKFTFSNALAMSVKLSIWEASLDSYIDNIEFVTEELSKSGHVPLTEEQVLQRMGQLYALRHLINLSSDLLDTPDFYWDHEALAQLFNRTANHLSIHKRTSVMNVKLGHCVELMDLLKSHLNQRHSARLEWIIIVLIMIEVFFEIVHFIK